MGLFKKAKDALGAAQQQGDGMVHVRGAGPIDPALLGGPSNRSVAETDPIWAPINGISLENYAELALAAQARGVTDEAGMIALGRRARAGTPPTPRPRSTAGCSGWASRWPSGSSSASCSATDPASSSVTACRTRCIE